MKRTTIVFDQLLRKILPVDRLPLVDQADIRATLQEGNPQRIERVALEAIEKLTRLGHLRLVEETSNGEDRVIRYRDLTSANTISIRSAAGNNDRGMMRIPLPLRQWRSTASLESVRSMFGLYGRILGRDTELLASVPEILRQILSSVKALVGCDSVNYAPVSRGGRTEIDMDPSIVAVPYDSYLIEEWVVDKNYMIYVPEILRSEAARPVPEGMKSLVLVRLGDQLSGISGALQVWSATPHFFNEERLGLLSLLSESGTDLVGRAAVLGRLVFVDAATKVYNRSYFNIQLENEIARARREGESLALVIYDIDDFKVFNTKYGYEGGNEVLSRVARILKSGLRPFDTVARWGGEEFTLILTAPIGIEDARTVTTRLRRAVEKQLFNITGLEGKSHHVALTVSAGGALYPSDAVSGTDLWRAANSALMWSKEHGKNQVTFYSELAEGGPPQEKTS
jgi:diguanylate cyclase (GGDEF)-like protein